MLPVTTRSRPTPNAMSAPVPGVLMPSTPPAGGLEVDVAVPATLPAAELVGVTVVVVVVVVFVPSPPPTTVAVDVVPGTTTVVFGSVVVVVTVTVP